MEDLGKLSLNSLRILGEYMSIPDYPFLNKNDLVNTINRVITEELLEQIGGTDFDTCSYPCPQAPDGRHRFRVRGSGFNSEGESESIWECQHCGCISR